MIDVWISFKLLSNMRSRFFIIKIKINIIISVVNSVSEVVPFYDIYLITNIIITSRKWEVYFTRSMELKNLISLKILNVLLWNISFKMYDI